MKPEWILAWAAIATLFAGGLGLALKTTFQFGRHSERLDAAAQRLAKVEDAQKQAAVEASETAVKLGSLEATVKGVDRALHDGFDRLDHLIRNMMQGMVASGGNRRRRDAGDQP